MNIQEEPQDYELVEKLYPDEEINKRRIDELFNEASIKSERILNESGFYVWVIKDDLGYLVCYTKTNEDSTEFIVKQEIIKGKVVKFDISGKFFVNNHEIDIDLSQEEGSSLLSHYIYVDSKLFASRLDPFSDIQNMALKFAKDVSESNGGRFERAMKENTIPYIKKMLAAFLESHADEVATRAMFDKMNKVKSADGMVEWRNQNP